MTFPSFNDVLHCGIGSIFVPIRGWRRSFRRKESRLRDFRMGFPCIVKTCCCGKELGSGVFIWSIVAMGLHFVTTDHGMRRDHSAAYDRVSRWVLSGAVLVGWAAYLNLAYNITFRETFPISVCGTVIRANNNCPTSYYNLTLK